jgi:hypothetical protein
MSSVTVPVPVSIVQYGKIYKATYTFVLGSVSVQYIGPDGVSREISKRTVGGRPDTIARMVLHDLVDSPSPPTVSR